MSLVKLLILSWLTSFLLDCFQHVFEWLLFWMKASYQWSIQRVRSWTFTFCRLYLMISSSVSSCLFKFADDVKLYHLISNPTDIQLLYTYKKKDIDSLYEWSSNWLLSSVYLNVKLCKLASAILMTTLTIWIINHYPLFVMRKIWECWWTMNWSFIKILHFIVAKVNHLLAIINKTCINLDAVTVCFHFNINL